MPTPESLTITAEAMAYGWGSVTAVSRATDLSIDTIRKGMAELSLRDTEPDAPVETRLRSPDGGRQRARVRSAHRFACVNVQESWGLIEIQMVR